MTAFLQSDCGCGCAELASPCDSCPPPCTPPAPVVTGGTATGRVGVPFSYTIVATNSPTSYSAAPLPAGLSLTGNTISGTPTIEASTLVTIGASNACGSGTASLEITIEAAVPCSGTPTLVCDTIAASKSKCGFVEYPGYASTPPKYYLTRTWDGSIREIVFSDDACGLQSELIDTFYSGSITYARDGTYSGSHTVVEPSGTTTITDPTTNLSQHTAQCNAVECPPAYTSNEVLFTGDNVCYGAAAPTHKFQSTAAETYTNEFTTALLIGDAEAALPSFPGTWAGDCAAIRDLAADESSYSVQRFKYKFQLPDMSGNVQAEITWTERFTPEGGGSPVDTNRSYTWDGIATETGEYTVNEPVTNGTIEIVNVQMTCA